MEYEFLDKAQEQPDLQDVVEYLKSPLYTVHELLKRYGKFSIADKTQHDNLEIYYQIDRVINRHLANLIDNYCQFSLKYRNSHPIKKENKNGKTVQYTAKDLLLKDLGKIIEEITLIEERFNEVNKVDFLAKNRIISELGYQKNLLNTETEPEAVNLNNQFNYQNFSQDKIENIFVKPEPVKPKPQQEAKTLTSVPNQEDIQEAINSKQRISITFTALVGFSMLVASFIFANHEPSKPASQPVAIQQPVEKVVSITKPVMQYSRLAQDLELVTSVIHGNHTKNPNVLLNNQNIFDTPLLQANQLRNISTITDATIKKNNDAFSVAIPAISKKDCEAVVTHSYKRYDTVKINHKAANYGSFLPSTVASMADSMCAFDKNVLEIIDLK